MKRSLSNEGESGGDVKRANTAESPPSTAAEEKAEIKDSWVLGSAHKQGERDEMQDRETIVRDFDCGVSNLKRSSLVCLFDGHAGVRAAEFCKNKFHVRFQAACRKHGLGELSVLEKSMKKIFTETYKTVDEEFLAEARKLKPAAKGRFDGHHSVLPERRDLRGRTQIVCRRSGDKLLPFQLTADHDPKNFEERQRIQAFGDGQLKAHGLICTPAIKKLTLTSDDLFLILACDGLWKVFSSEEAIAFVRQRFDEKKKTADVRAIANEIAESLAAEAVLRKCGDNVSVILVLYLLRT
ncbi:PPM-type phosphatase domain-containing protein [Aphelenchoides fujianensis]|nr:PPM-type phosphatase domain-containing protein [Aphelenchoides fujianensis]